MALKLTSKISARHLARLRKQLIARGLDPEIAQQTRPGRAEPVSWILDRAAAARCEHEVIGLLRETEVTS